MDKINSMENEINNMSYEDAINELEKILNMMDKGELPLDESMNNFERGMKLVTYCEKILNSYERKITRILEDRNGNLRESDINE